ncbi:hypothetical protein P280DRAFT_513076 [Massarina eburnea CBS 473.64]|uniref:Uncharacterized protein n=1 Tax=Massarina eburnea CBS 473.64 TaxID=1395130 RepID=A0A6A6SHT9_9PLEO|nr:hypothetical protein P280DRAFT_513076 [Massarina eburnea CBS 473.64]
MIYSNRPPHQALSLTLFHLFHTYLFYTSLEPHYLSIPFAYAWGFFLACFLDILTVSFPFPLPLLTFRIGVFEAVYLVFKQRFWWYWPFAAVSGLVVVPGLLAFGILVWDWGVRWCWGKIWEELQRLGAWIDEVGGERERRVDGGDLVREEGVRRRKGVWRVRPYFS